MSHLEQLVDELAQFGSTNTNVVYKRTHPYRGPQGPARELEDV